jgi:hypothetical protein
VKELRLKIPSTFKSVEINGANIRRRDQNGDEWRVELQSKVRGFYILNVTWEQPKANSLEVTGISAAGVERETGLITIVAKPPLQVAERDARDLNRVDTRDFPDWAGRADDATVLAYRYIRPGYSLALDLKRFDEAEVLQALVDSVQLTTVVADDGQTMTEMSLAVRNNGRQFLEIELPTGSSVWSAFVAGQPVRPSKRDGKLLLPLEQSGSDDAPVAVALTYVGTNTFPKTHGAVAFVSPKLDVPLKAARWELFLPPDYNYDNFGGTMARELVADKALASLWSTSFSLSEYNEKERANKAASIADARKDVGSAQRKLAEGNLREATTEYNRAKVKSLSNAGGETDETKQLGQQLRNAQGNNLIVSQNAFISNNGNFTVNQGGVDQTPMNAGTQNFTYANADAEQQWERLQQAQEVVAVKIQPLHVNLPTRGIRYAFTQVLQTEINKPMTIQLQAANAKTGHWLGRVGLGAVGFLMLWAVVAGVSARKQNWSAAR